MDTVTRNVKDINTADRQAIEHVLGQPLVENQQIVIQVLPPNTACAAANSGPHCGAQPTQLPAWCNIYEGLGDAEVLEIENSILRSPGSRSTL